MTFTRNSDEAWHKANGGDFIVYRLASDEVGATVHVEWAVATPDERKQIDSQWQTWQRKES